MDSGAQGQISAVSLILILSVHSGGIVMKLLKDHAFFMGLAVIGVFLPVHTNASGPASAPEPVSLALLAVGAAGLGAAAWIHRHKDK